MGAWNLCRIWITTAREAIFLTEVFFHKEPGLQRRRITV